MLLNRLQWALCIMYFAYITCLFLTGLRTSHYTECVKMKYYTLKKYIKLINQIVGSQKNVSVNRSKKFN